MHRFILYSLWLVLGFLPLNSHAIEVQTLKTGSGTPFWLVQTHGLPLVGVRVAFKAGTAYDIEGQEGIATLTANLLNESVGDMDARSFAEHLQDTSSTLRVFVGDDIVGITLMTLRDSRNEGASTLNKVLTEPAFTRSDTRRVREAMLATQRQQAKNPTVRARQELRKLVYGKHPYGRPLNGYPHTLEKLTHSDVQTYFKQRYTTGNMTISIVGDVSVDEAKQLVVSIVKNIPTGVGNGDALLPPFTPPAQALFVEQNIPQTSIHLGHLGIDRNDPDYPAAQVLNYILGGGMFVNRLVNKIRVQEGLAYRVGSRFVHNHLGGTFEVVAQTRNDNADRVIALIKDQVRRIRASGVEAEEYRTAQDYLLGSLPLNMTTTSDMLSYLTLMQMEGLGSDYLTTWPDRIKAVTREDGF